jgi:phosphate-selective porin OprO and OprP
MIPKSIILMAVCATFTSTAYAQDDDVLARIKELETKMQLMQEQRAEQDRHIEQLNNELSSIENKVANTAVSDQKSKSKGSPVYAAFKDGVTFQDESGDWKLAINGRVQTDYRSFSPDEDSADTFSLRRARLGGTLTFYNDYVARVEGDYSGSSTSLTYGYIDINKFKKAKIRLGQFKPSFGLERATSTNFTDFQERSMGDALLGSTYDRGIMVSGSPVLGFDYSVAYLNGTGTSDESNASSDSKDIAIRLTTNVAEFMSWKNTVVHFGGFYADGDQSSRNQAGVTPSGRTSGRGLTFFQTNCSATDCGTAVKNGFGEDVQRTKSGLESAVAFGPVKFQTEYIKVKFEGDDFDRELSNWYASGMWNVTGESFSNFYKGGTFGRFKPTNNFTEGASGWGAFQVGIRYDDFDGSDYKQTATGSNAAGGVLLNSPGSTADGLLVATNQASAWTLGANWILNPNMRLVANYIRTNYDTDVVVRVNGKNDSIDHEDAVTMRAQFDF